MANFSSEARRQVLEIKLRKPFEEVKTNGERRNSISERRTSIGGSQEDKRKFYGNKTYNQLVLSNVDEVSNESDKLKKKSVKETNKQNKESKLQKINTKSKSFTMKDKQNLKTFLNAQRKG